MPKLALIGLVALTAGATAGSSPRLVARIPTGVAPGGAVSAFGAVWVTNDRSGTLTRIDPATNSVTRRIRLRQGVFSVAAGFGSLWAINYERGSLARIDPRSGRVRTVPVGAGPDDVLVAFGRVWVTAWDAEKLVEIEPRSLRVVRRIRVGPRPAGLRAAAGAVWVGFGRSATAIARVTPRTGAIERVPVGVRTPALFVAGTRDLWIKAADNVLVRVDPSTRRVLARLSFGRTLALGALAQDGKLWVPDKEQNLVYRVDPSTARVEDSFGAGQGAFVALRAHGSMWVTSYAGDDVWRFAPGGALARPLRLPGVMQRTSLKMTELGGTGLEP
jgi:streptogramin lyase